MDAPDPLGSRIGPYRIVERIGEGGMGLVYLAEQDQPLHRRVALKVIRPGLNSKAVSARFEAERQALAFMEHPNIAKVLDAGTTLDDRPYFVMEYVNGEPVTRYCDHHRLKTTHRLELFITVCHAVQHAHQKAIIHRDIKPSNILVATVDGVPVPKIIDFGVAKALQHKLTQRTLFTELGQIVGTLEYMSPEQAEMSALSIDTRTDIYALGVVLYELLAGALPFESRALRQAAFGEIQRIIREDTPPKPSTRFSSLGAEDSAKTARERHTERSALARQLRGDLDWITMKAMAKDRVRRYATAAELVEDIQRHLNNEAVLAGPPSTAYLLRKFVRRNRGPVTATTLVAVALVGGLALTTSQAVKAERLSLRAELSAMEERSALDIAQAKTAEATASRLRQRAAYEEVLRLSDLKRLADAQATAEQLWPADPQHIEAMQSWLSQHADPLRDNLPTHRATLTALRRDALADQSEGADSDPRRWRFATAEAQWQHDTLNGLVEGLQLFLDPDPQKGAVASVQARLAFARTIEQRSISGPQVSSAWEQATADIATLEIYGGLQLKPQLGLVPLHRDPGSGLWEFWHVQTGNTPQPSRDPAASSVWNVTGDTGLVFVLVPGATFWMGAQDDDPSGRNYDGNAKASEKPVHQATVAPFFISKYEMIQGQWLRFAGSNPSAYGPGFQVSGTTHDLRHPIESVSWHDCQLVLERLGLVLPTEAEWEYVSRAGSSTPWWCGAEPQDIQGNANLSDRTAHNTAPAWRHQPELDDGYVSHAPVGSFGPNGFGLHDTIGNVYEWCRDWYQEYSGNVAENLPAPSRVARGGAYDNAADNARSATRNHITPKSVAPNCSLRPARPIEP